MNSSPTIGKLAAALVAVQPLFPTVPKTKIGKIPLKSGGSYSYTYADFADVMDAVKPILNGAGIAVLQLPNGNAIETVLLHESGEWISGTLELVDCTDPQKQGSAITYGRRYSLSAVLGIVTEDDDDGAAATHSAPAASQQRPQASERPSEGPTAYAGARQTQSAPTGDKRRVTSEELAYYQFAEELNLKSAEPNSFMTDVVGKMAKWEVSPKQIAAVEKTAFKILSEAGFDPKGERQRLSTAVASVAEAFAPTEATFDNEEPF